MLTLICGTSRGKRKDKLIQAAEQAVHKDQVSRHILWLTPDQYSFETERDLLHRVTPMARSQMTVTGFSRFANTVMKQYGGIAARYADNLCKTILMRRAAEDCVDTLQLYGGQIRAKDSQFQDRLLQFIQQMKFAGVTPQELFKIGENRQLGESLRAKASDLATLALHYEARLSASWRDSLDDLAAANQRIEAEEKDGVRFFAGMTVLLDGFKSFTAPQYEMIRRMLKQDAEVIVSLDLDRRIAKSGNSEIYAVPWETYNALIALSDQQYRSIELRPDEPQNELEYLKQNLFLDPMVPYAGKLSDKAGCYLCRDEYAEAEFCFGRIKAMLKDTPGLRLRDFAVVYRNEAEYRLPIAAAAEKFDLVYCVDGGEDAYQHPLLQLCGAMLRMAYQRFTAVEALTVIKSGLFPAEATEITELDEYLQVWRPDSRKDWMLPFTASIGGYETESESRTQALSDAPEQIRQRLLAALEQMDQMQRGTAKEYGAALYRAIEQLGAIDRFSEQLLLTENVAAQMEQKRVWNGLCDILTRLSDTLADEVLEGKEYCRLFLQSVKETRLKSVEQSVDCIMVGCADQIRLHDPKVLWILGANDGIFPKRPDIQNGLFSDQECRMLSDLELKVGRTAEERLAEERYTAYQMVAAPSEALYITCRKADLGGGKQLSGELIWRMEILLGERCRLGVLGESERMTTPQAAFEAYCRTVRTDPKSANRYLDLLQRMEDRRYAAPLQTVQTLLNEREFALTDPKLSESLYGLYDRMLSPSEIEHYFSCPFAYYVKYGLKLKIREKAVYNPLLRGNMIHHLIAMLTLQISEMAKKDAKRSVDTGALPQKQAVTKLLHRMVDQAFDAEIAERFDEPGRISAKDKVLAESMRQTVYRICENIYAEQLQSKFEVFAVEFDIGYRAIAPLKVPVESGKTVRIRGRVDRMDIYELDGTTYFRVIDYKSGKEEFQYSKLTQGDQLQMILYEMAIEHGGKVGFAGMVPSGVLYYPARKIGFLDQRAVSEAELEELLASGFCMSGFLVDEAESMPLVRAMEEKLRTYYIPVGFNEKNVLETGSLRSEEEYRRMERYVINKVRRMALSVASGDLSPIYPTDTTACRYCHYRGLCGKDVRSETGEREKLNEKDAREWIFEKEEATWD